ncbi:hypothetical protein D3C73_1278740 [compost metagenome]
MPPLASSNLPRRSFIAPVKAPRTWPNNSLSTRVSGSAAQLRLMIGLSARGEAAWMAWATNSLPTPVSPVINTVRSLPPTRLISSTRRLWALLWPIISRFCWPLAWR